MATKALNYTAAEINQRLNLAGTAVQPNALNDYYTKTEVDGKVVVDLSTRYNTSYANLSAALTALNNDTSTDATAIKKGGVSVKFINSTTNKYEQWNLKASSWSVNTSDWVKAVDSADIPINKIESGSTQSEDEEQVWGNDAGTQEYAKIGSYGMKSKAYLDMQGNSIIDGEIGDTPSTTHAPSAKAVKDYVNEHGGGDLPIEKTAISSPEEHIVIRNSADTEDVFKVTDEGLRVKSLKDMQGNPISDINPIIVRVDINGSGDYTSLREALEYCTNHPNADGYIVEVYPGTYNVANDFTEEEITNATYYPTLGFVGLYVTNGITLRGVGNRDEIIIHGELPTTYSVYNREAISTLNPKGNVKIENLTITSRNIRYPIHDDFAESVNATRHYKNCKIINYISASGGQNNAIGIGTRGGDNIIIEDCYMEPLFYVHNNVNHATSAMVRLINSDVTGTIGVGDSNSGSQCRLELINTNYNVLSHSKSQEHQYFDIYGRGNAHGFVKCSSDTYYYLDEITLKRLIWGGQKGQCVQLAGKTDLYSQSANSFLYAHSCKDSKYFYGILLDAANAMADLRVQHSGYVAANQLGNTDYSQWQKGDYLAPNSSSALLEVTNNIENAVARVVIIVNDIPYIKIIK